MESIFYLKNFDRKLASFKLFAFSVLYVGVQDSIHRSWLSVQFARTEYAKQHSHSNSFYLAPITLKFGGSYLQPSTH